MKNKMERRDQQSQSANMGFVPPHDTELERAVLGAMLLERNVYSELATLINPDTFYDDRHAIIFKAIRLLADENIPIDMMTVANQLDKDKKLLKVGGPAYLAGLTQVVGSAAHTGHHAKILYEMSVLRQMITSFTALASTCYEGDFDTANDQYSAVTAQLDSLFSGGGSDKHIRTILQQHGQVLEQRVIRANSGDIPGLTYGLSELDALTGGMQPGQLIIIAGRPGMGKTAVALHFAKSPATHNNGHVMVASLEMTSISLTDRLLSSCIGIKSENLRSGRMNSDDWRAYELAQGELSKLNIYIDDTAGTTLNRLRAIARTKRRKGELDLLIIDYLQLIESDSNGGGYKQNREREVAEISRGLKKLAKELSIPVILLCQLNRAAESRTDKKPQLFDLRESGAIEQDADLVLMPFRPNYYPDIIFTEYENGPEIPADVGMIFIRKQRDGSQGTAYFQFSKDLGRLSDYDRDIPGNNSDNNELVF